MRNPFKLFGPICVSFSGGRSSAYMLRAILDANDGLPADSAVCFANTGKEREETLRFIDRCAREWGIQIAWLEYIARSISGFKVVDFASAARAGEPFDRLIEQKQRLPNPVERACTEELKVNTIARYMRSLGMDDEDVAIGVRADEPHRIPKLRARGRWLPMVDAGLGKHDIHRFWRASPFDLELPYADGHGNCDLCFLKTAGQVLARVREKPQLATWWIAKEKQTGGRFQKDRPDYATMQRFAGSHDDLFADDGAQGLPCFCGD